MSSVLLVACDKSSDEPAVTTVATTEEEEQGGNGGGASSTPVEVDKVAGKTASELYAQFLEEYKASVEYTTANPKEASELIVSTGVFAGKAPIAEKAIPKCNIVYLDGKDMKTALNTFFSKLYAVAPASIGGAIPDDGIYFSK